MEGSESREGESLSQGHHQWQNLPWWLSHLSTVPFLRTIGKRRESWGTAPRVPQQAPGAVLTTTQYLKMAAGFLLLLPKKEMGFTQHSLKAGLHLHLCSDPLFLQVPCPHPCSSHHFHGSQPNLQLPTLVSLLESSLWPLKPTLPMFKEGLKSWERNTPRSSHQPMMIDNWVSLLGDSKVHIWHWSQSGTMWLSPSGPQWGLISCHPLYWLLSLPCLTVFSLFTCLQIAS